jgi:glycosyltransferase involved in cell wall biosynthesis
MKNSTKLSVLMSAYNGGRLIHSAIESVLNQTFGDFELLIVDDGSTDSTADIIRTYLDPRIRCVRNALNIGLTRSLQVGLSLTQAEYVARLDADDICLPNRLAYQVSYLDTHPQIAVLGSAYEVINETGSLLQTCYPPTSPPAIAWRLLFSNPLAHSSVMFRRDVIVNLGGYNENIRYAQDYNLWSRVSMAGYGIAQLEVPLIRLREHPSRISQAKQSLSRESALNTAQDNIQRLVGYPVNPCVMAYLMLFGEIPLCGTASKETR